MDNMTVKDIESLSTHRNEEGEAEVSPDYKLAKGKIRWLLMLGIVPLEDESGNIVYRFLNGYDSFM